MGGYLKGIIFILIVLFFITFGVKNNQPVRLNYYFDVLSVELPMYGLIYISMLMGIFLGIVIGIRSRLRLRRGMKNLQSENKDLKEKLIKERDERGKED